MSQNELNDATDLPTLPMYIQDIRRYLPHAYPFLLVDRITDLEFGQRIEGYKNLTMNEEFFQGHFPRFPITPGVLIMEALAQISGILAMIFLHTTPEQGDNFLFAGMEKVRFKRPVVPGDKLVLKSEMIMNRRGVFKFQAVACVDDKIVAQAELTLSQQKIVT